MKKYYHTLSRDKKQEIKNIYKQEYKKSDLSIRLVRLMIYAAIGYITSIVLFIDAIFNKTSITLNIIIASILILSSTCFLVGSIVIKQKLLNKIALKRKK